MSSQPSDPYKAKNAEDPSPTTKISDLVSFLEKHKFCMLTTEIPSGHLVSRAMALATSEHGGADLLFHANTESGKTSDLAQLPKANLAFLTPGGEWASVSGDAAVETDRQEIRRYYTPALKAWLGDLGDGTHDGGPEDPRLCMIRVKAVTAQYAVSKKTAVGAAVEFAKGVVTGEAPDVNRLRFVDEDEFTQWRNSH